MRRPVWSRRALDDLEELRDRIAADRPRAALKVFVRIVEHVDLLGSQPFLGRSGRIGNTRELVVPRTPYIIAYAVMPERVEVLAVLHGARKWPESF